MYPPDLIDRSHDSSLPADVVEHMLARIEVAAFHGCEEEAVAAVAAGWREFLGRCKISRATNLSEIPAVPHRLVNRMGEYGLVTVGDLEKRMAELKLDIRAKRIKGVGKRWLELLCDIVEKVS